MNYLVHLHLSDPDPEFRLGNLMGDFVKGPLTSHWPQGILQGLIQHRQVDAFAQHNPAFRRSKRRVDDRFGCRKPILIDIFYDHFLARDWEKHSPFPLADFTGAVYRLLAENADRLPAGLREVAPRMIAHDWLGSYRDPEIIGVVLERLARRLSRPGPMADGLVELLNNYQELREDFEEFLAEATKEFRG